MGKSRKRLNIRYLKSYWIKASLYAWILSLIIFFLLLYFSTNGFRGTIDDTEFGRSSAFFPVFSLTILLGGSAFLSAILGFTVEYLEKTKPKKRKFSYWLKFFLALAIFPLLFIQKRFSPVRSLKQLMKKGVKKTIAKEIRNPKRTFTQAVAWSFAFVLIGIWIFGYLVVGLTAGSAVGLVGEPVPISGTGSMYPTFPKGQGKSPPELAQETVAYPGMQPYPNGVTLFGKRYFGHELGRGDIVSFFNERTAAITEKEYGLATAFIKRIIGLPGDVIEIREGLVFLNGELLMEPYIARARSTFGGTFVSECKKREVPEGELLVLGDNRTASQDSRFEELGFVSYEDVDYVIPFKKQEGELDKNWRDTSNDLSESAKIKLNKDEFLRLLNEKRKESGVKPLSYKEKLQMSAEKRATVMLKYDDFSFEATRSGYTISRALAEVGYWNPVWGEEPILGYFSENELIEYLFEFPESKKFYTEKDFQDIGVGVVEGELNNCPTQVIALHIAGYVPPNYTKEEIESWSVILNRLREIQPGWSEVKTWDDFYGRNKKDVDRINEIIAIRIANISTVVAKMEKNQWLGQKELDYTYQDQSLYEEQQATADRLNSQ